MTTPSKSPRTDAKRGFVQDANFEHSQSFELSPDGDYVKAEDFQALEIELGEVVAEITARRAVMADIVAYLGKGCTGLSNAEILPELKQQNTFLLAQIAVKDEALKLVVETDDAAVEELRRMEIDQKESHITKKCRIALTNSTAAKELLLSDKRLKALSHLIWETRWAGEQPDYQDMVGIAAEINSGNFNSIDKHI